MKIRKIYIVLIALLVIININIKSVYATHTAGEVVSEANGFIQKGEANGDKIIKTSNLQNMSNMLYNILLTIGIIIIFITGGILGIKFITGGLEEKADIKKTLVPFVAGCIVIFGAFTIWKIVLIILQ